MIKWVIGVLAVIALGIGGYFLFAPDVLTDYSPDEPGVVYNNDGDGHSHDHGYFGVE